MKQIFRRVPNKNEKWCDEGTLIEALKSYLMWFCNDDLLYEVADFAGNYHIW